MEYYIHDGTTQMGPFTKEEIKSRYNQRGYFTWKEGMQEWEPVASLFLQPKNESMPPVMAIPASTPAAAAVKNEKSRGMRKLIFSITTSVLVLGLGVASFILYKRLEAEKERYRVLHHNVLRESFMIRELAFENNIPKVYIQRAEDFYSKVGYTLQVKFFDKKGSLVKYQDNDLDLTYVSKIQLDNTTPELRDWIFFAPESKAAQFVLTPSPRIGDDQKYIPFPALPKGEYRVEIWRENNLLASANHRVQ